MRAKCDVALYQKAARYITMYNRTKDYINETVARNNIQFPETKDLTMSHVMVSIMPKSRWAKIVTKLFDGVDPPIKKYNGAYLNYFIPEAEMTQEQKNSISKLREHPSAIMWLYLTTMEKYYITGALHGIYLHIEMLKYFVDKYLNCKINGAGPQQRTQPHLEEVVDDNMRPSKRMRV